MTLSNSLNLITFIPILDQLANQVDSTSSDPVTISSASTALSSGIVATALLQANSAPDSACPWEGSLNGQTLIIYSALHQFVFTLEMNTLSSAVLTGPSDLIWKLNKSDKGLHVSTVDINGTILNDSIICLDGSVKDSTDISSEMDDLSSDWKNISETPEDSLPSYVPDFALPEIDLPSIEDLPDTYASDDTYDEDCEEESTSEVSIDEYDTATSHISNTNTQPIINTSDESNTVASTIDSSIKNVVIAGVAVASAAAVAKLKSKASSKPTPPSKKAPLEKKQSKPISIKDNKPLPPKASSPNTHIICSNCKAKLAFDANFCSRCGTTVCQTKTCSECAFVLENDDVFCSSCGKSVNEKQSKKALVNKKIKTSSNKPHKIRKKMDASKNLQKKKKHNSKEHNQTVSDDSFNEYTHRISDDSSDEHTRKIPDDESIKLLPSVRWVSFLFAIICIIDFVVMIDASGSAILETIAFHRMFATAISTIFFAFIAGSSSGFFRILTLISAVIFIINQINFYSDFYEQVLNNPKIVSDDLLNVLPFISLLFALWLIKRAAKRS